MQPIILPQMTGFGGMSAPLTVFDIDGKKSGLIRLLAPIDNETVARLLNALDQAVTQNAQEVIILISSPGGSTLHGLSAYNYIRGLPFEVTTINFGSVDSISSVVYAAGSRRLCVPNARFLLHGVSAQIQGTGIIALEEKQVEEMLKGIKIDVQNIARVIADRTNKKAEEVYTAMVNRTTLDPEQAVKFGLVHKIQQVTIPQSAQVLSIQK